MSKRCDATGKVCFETFTAAKERMWALKMIWKKRYYGKRIKHRQGKSVLKRVYHCDYCDTFHLTHWSYYPYPQKKEPFHKAKQSLILPIR